MMKTLVCFIKLFIIKMYSFLLLSIFQAKWRVRNKENKTDAGTIFPTSKVSVGKETYGTLNVISYNNQNEKLSIGAFCSIAGNVRFILGGEHNYNNISSYPFKRLIVSGQAEALTKGAIIVNDDVWLGFGSTILSGVHIGQGAVIAAGTVVTKDVPPYAIVGGVPAKIIKYRFSPEIIEMIKNVDYSRLTERDINENIDKLYLRMTKDTDLSWLPMMKNY